MHRDEKIRFLIFRTLGNFFILLTIFGFLATFGPAIYFETIYRVSIFRGVQYSVIEDQDSPSFGKLLAERRNQEYQSQPVTDSSTGLFNAVLNGEREQVLVPKDPHFSLVIPKIGASQKVFENVDPSNDEEYKNVLLHGVAQAQGSSFPGYGGNTYIFAHSADSFWNVGRYNAVFYLLKELKPGDDVILFFLNKRYNYTVYDTKIVDADNVSYITSQLDGQGETVTLQTCWPPGTTWKRLLVFAKPKKI